MPPVIPVKRVLIRHCLKPSGLGVLGAILFILSTFFLTIPPVLAATPSTLNFQARLESSSGAIVADGNYNIEFKLYNVSSAGTAEWTEDYLNSASQGVHVANGYLSVNLGSITAFPGTINWDQQQYLTMNIGGVTTGSVTWDGEMNPRIPLTGVPYAFQSQSAEGLTELQGSATDSLKFATDTTTSNTITLPDLGGSFGLLALQASTPVQQTGGFNVSGEGLMGSAQVGAATAIAGQLTVDSSSSSQRTLVLQAAVGQSVDVLDIYNSGGGFVSGYDASGNEYINGKLVTGTTSSVGEIDFKDGTANNYSTFIVNQALSGSQTITLPNASGTVCLTSQNCSTAGSGYILNQSATPGIQQTGGNFNVSGTGIAGILQAGTIDTASAGALSIGTTNATSITLGHSATFSNGASRTLKIAAASSGVGNQLTIAAGNGSSGNTGGNLLLEAGANGTANGTPGSVVVQANGGDSTSAFKVQNAGGTQTVLNVDTVNGCINIGNTACSGIADSLYIPWSSGYASHHLLVVGSSTDSTDNVIGIDGQSYGDAGVSGTSVSNNGVKGSTTSGVGVYGQSTSGTGVEGYGSSGAGIIGTSDSNSSGYFVSNSATNAQPTLVVQQTGSGTADLFRVETSGSSTLVGVGSAGAVTLQNSSNSTSAFQVRASGGSAVLNVDTTDQYVGIGTSAPGATFDVESAASTGTAANFTAYGLTTGNGVNINTNSATQTAGSLLNVTDTATLATNGGSLSGNLVNVSRSLTANVPGGGTSTPTFDNKGIFAQSATSYPSAWTNAFTVNTGHSNYYVFASIYDKGACDGAPSSVKYGSSTLSFIKSATGGTDAAPCLYLFGGTVTATGSNTLSITPFDANAIYDAQVDDWYNVNQSTPTGTAVNGGGTGTPSVTSSAWTSGHVIVDHNTVNDTSCNITPSAGQTAIYSACSGSNSTGMYASYKTSAGGSQTMSWSASGGYWADNAVDLIGATITVSESVTSPVASFSNNCTLTAGTCNDASSVLSLNQQYSGATGPVLKVQNSGTGTALTVQNGSGSLALTVATANLTGIDVTTSNTAAVLTLGKITGGDSIAAEGAVASSLGDYAEYFPQAVPGQLQPGEVTCLNASGDAEPCDSSKTADTLAGVVSTAPGFVGNNQIHDAKNPDSTALVSMLGQVPVKVSTANGAINVGDELSMSSMSGVAVKAVSPGMVIGTALEPYSSAGTGEVQVYIHISFYDTLALQSNGLDSGYVLQGDEANLSGLTVNGNATFGTLTVETSATIPTLTVTSSLSTIDLTVSGHITTNGNNPTIVPGTAAGSGTVSVAVSGNDVTGKISITLGDNATAGSLASLDFDHAYDAPPNIVITAGNSSAAQIQGYVDPSVTGFSLNAATSSGLISGKTYVFYYHVIQ